MNKVKIAIETAQQLADLVAHWSDKLMTKDWALTATISGVVGVVVRNERGYYSTGVGLAKYDYHKLDELCDGANAILFPNRTPKENYSIVLSSMLKP